MGGATLALPVPVAPGGSVPAASVWDRVHEPAIGAHERAIAVEPPAWAPRMAGPSALDRTMVGHGPGPSMHSIWSIWGTGAPGSKSRLHVCPPAKSGVRSFLSLQFRVLPPLVRGLGGFVGEVFVPALRAGGFPGAKRPCWSRGQASEKRWRFALRAMASAVLGRSGC